MDSISKTDDENRILDLCESELSELGFRPVDVDFSRAGAAYLRLFVERVAGEGSSGDASESAVSIGDCAKISRLMAPKFNEALELEEGSYDFEVSSPGLDRRLRLKSDFEGQIGESLKLKLINSVEGWGQKPGGTLKSVNEAGICLLRDSQEVEIDFSNISKAVRVWKF